MVANAPLVAVAVAFVTGTAIRAYYVLRESFPVNDGGMFYAMARDIQSAGYLLPRYTDYNGGEIPFVYPPLTLYAAALGDALTPASLLDMSDRTVRGSFDIEALLRVEPLAMIPYIDSPGDAVMRRKQRASFALIALTLAVIVFVVIRQA